MRNDDSKLLLGVLLGAAIGATVTYLLTSDKKEQWMEEINVAADKVKDGLNNVVTKIKDSTKKVEEVLENPEA